MPKQDEEVSADERAAWVEFKAQKKAPRERKPVDPSVARANAEAAKAVAQQFLAEAPSSPVAASVSLDDDRPQASLEAEPESQLSTVTCRCGQLLGHATRGVCVEGVWHCPKCFMRTRDYNRHPVARAVNCPTCHRTSVDFTGRNTCSVCGARGATPLRPAS